MKPFEAVFIQKAPDVALPALALSGAPKEYTAILTEVDAIKEKVSKIEDKELNEIKSHFEMTYTSIVKVDEKVINKKELEKILLCDVQNKIYPNLEKIFLDLLHNSGFSEIKFDKKVDFNKLYNEKFN